MEGRKRREATDLVTKQIEAQVNAEDWVDPTPGEPHYGSNQLIGAYNAGVDAGVKKAFKLIEDWAGKIRDENTSKAGEHTQHVLDFLRKLEFHPKKAILNATQFDDLRVLIFLPLEEYTSEAFSTVYETVGGLELEWEQPGYSIEFIFSDDSPEINEGLLRADGYILHHTSLRK